MRRLCCLRPANHWLPSPLNILVTIYILLKSLIFVCLFGCSALYLTLFQYITTHKCVYTWSEDNLLLVGLNQYIWTYSATYVYSPYIGTSHFNRAIEYNSQYWEALHYYANSIIQPKWTHKSLIYFINFEDRKSISLHASHIVAMFSRFSTRNVHMVHMVN